MLSVVVAMVVVIDWLWLGHGHAVTRHDSHDWWSLHGGRGHHHWLWLGHHWWWHVNWLWLRHGKSVAWHDSHDVWFNPG